jgi:LysM repeat protein
VNPTKLWEYNFLYDRNAGVQTGDLLRVPYDQCEPQPGVWDCHDVVAGDTLFSIAHGTASKIYNTTTLKNYNLDILYGETEPYPGQQLRLPLYTCYPDENTDCYMVAAGDTLTSVSEYYHTTINELCNLNQYILGTSGSGCASRPKLNVGMELSIPRQHPEPPSPCKEIPGYWTCYTVGINDSMWNIAPKVHMSPPDFVEVNFGPHPPHCGNCSNTTACPPSLGPYPECLHIGQVLTAPVVSCTPKTGAYGCITMPDSNPYPGGSSLATYLLHDAGSPPDYSLFAKANPRQSSTPNYAYSGQIFKAPFVPCIPNDVSYCSNDPSGAGDWDASKRLSTGVGCKLCDWDGNSVAFTRATLYNGPTGHVRIPRGSVIPGFYPDPLPYPFTQSTECTPAPGKHLCHKPLVNDTVDLVASQFGVDATNLCKVNKLGNCSALYWEGSSLVIPLPKSEL